MLHIASPQGEVVPEQLHDQSGVLVRFLGQRVEFRDGVVERCLSQTACAFGRVKDLVVEHYRREGLQVRESSRRTRPEDSDQIKAKGQPGLLERDLRGRCLRVEGLERAQGRLLTREVQRKSQPDRMGWR